MDFQTRLTEINAAWRDFISQASNEICQIILSEFHFYLWDKAWHKERAKEILAINPAGNADLALRMAKLVHYRNRKVGNDSLIENLDHLMMKWSNITEAIILSEFVTFTVDLNLDVKPWLASYQADRFEICCMLSMITVTCQKHFGQEVDERLAWQERLAKDTNLFEMFAYGAANAESFLPKDMEDGPLWKAAFTGERLAELALGLSDKPVSEAEKEAIEKVNREFGCVGVLSTAGFFSARLRDITDPGWNYQPPIPVDLPPGFIPDHCPHRPPCPRCNPPEDDDSLYPESGVIFDDEQRFGESPDVL